LKNITRVAGAGAAGIGGWLAYSHFKMNKPVPPDEEVRAYAKSLLARVGLGELCDSWSEDQLELGDCRTCEMEFLYLPDAPHLVMTDNVDDLIPAVSAWLQKTMGS
jgi:hypothetical protein